KQVQAPLPDGSVPGGWRFLLEGETGNHFGLKRGRNRAKARSKKLGFSPPIVSSIRRHEATAKESCPNEPIILVDCSARNPMAGGARHAVIQGQEFIYRDTESRAEPADSARKPVNSPN